MKTALITGITGQDGSYLAELLLEKGYEVHGIIRRSSSFNTGRIDHIFDQLHLHYGDVTDSLMMYKLIFDLVPDEIYNLAAQSHVKVSFEAPMYTGQVDGLGLLNILEPVRQLKENGFNIKVYQASTSEMFGSSPAPQDENTPLHPRSPYGAAKIYAYWLAKTYRDSYGIFISNGILFNHESSRRGDTFVTKKIVNAAQKLKENISEYRIDRWDRPDAVLKINPIILGNLDAKRDWGHAKDYVRSMWMMLQQEQPDDFVVGTGETHTVREFLQSVFWHLKLGDITWKGDEGYLDDILVVKTDPRYKRPLEVDFLQANPLKVKRILGWEPIYDFNDLIDEMINGDEYV